ncbi:uncharacterized protein LAESUDRAFT_816522 [Laetiporus sulphureus 93-53]|uniref:REJ domain-containing protein n=1 Tax=Laetiporus sulphureus 93-53 TaxID=1314785 RepID=A0A165B7K7_9APHY|nr:uncharacterized protein LAESUDRAFT_816522 [Laetiporus sulphureus 93-53]KZT00428.1 hypothetical protein LAESUDRAFT_816522 [Laetiporus sulphureus 93-53]
MHLQAVDRGAAMGRLAARQSESADSSASGSSGSSATGSAQQPPSTDTSGPASTSSPVSTSSESPPETSSSSPAPQASSSTSSSETTSTSTSSSDTATSTPSSTSTSTSTSISSSPQSTTSSSSSPPPTTSSTYTTSSDPPTSSSTNASASTSAHTTSSSSSQPSPSNISSPPTQTAASTSNTASTSDPQQPTSTASSTTSASSIKGEIQTTITSSFVTTINGSAVSTFSLIPTTLSAPTSTTSSATNKAIIAGSVSGVAAFLALALAMILFYRRHQHKKLNFFRRKDKTPRNMLLAGEDMDDYDLPPTMRSYSDFPGPSSRTASYYSGSLNGPPLDPNAGPQMARIPSPHLMGMRTSESGSIFQEAVWPPPRAGLIDPLNTSSRESLSRIVDDVMGPAQAPSSSQAAASSGHGRSDSQTALLSSAPDSPKPTWRSPLFVTNMGSETASVSSPPRQTSKLAPQTRTFQDEDTGTYPMGEAL